MEELSVCLSRWMTERGGGNSAFIAAMLERAPISQAGMDVCCVVGKFSQASSEELKAGRGDRQLHLG